MAMRPTLIPVPNDHYRLEGELYVFYAGNTCVLVTPIVAVLIDNRLGVLITHGDPLSVRLELDAMRRAATATGKLGGQQDWVLLEGRPQLEALNDALRDSSDCRAIIEAFCGERARTATKIAHTLFGRLARLV
jgi:hypothetical protein